MEHTPQLLNPPTNEDTTGDDDYHDEDGNGFLTAEPAGGDDVVEGEDDMDDDSAVPDIAATAAFRNGEMSEEAYERALLGADVCWPFHLGHVSLIVLFVFHLSTSGSTCSPRDTLTAHDKAQRLHHSQLSVGHAIVRHCCWDETTSKGQLSRFAPCLCHDGYMAHPAVSQTVRLVSLTRLRILLSRLSTLSVCGVQLAVQVQSACT